jgi:EAL and modified HD-GYP domain-containing signal transduction protein
MPPDWQNGQAEREGTDSSMSTTVTFNSAHRILLASDFFMARRLVLDRRQRLAAYELVFCNADGDSGHDSHHPADLPAAASVIADVAQHGLLRIIGDGQAYLHVDDSSLDSGILAGLPRARIVLELLKSTGITPELVVRAARLYESGFSFALDAGTDADGMAQLLPLAQTVRIDIAAHEVDSLPRLCETLREQGKTLLAENVETAEDYRLCHALGFDCFRGYYFTKPAIRPGSRLAPSQAAIIELMALVASDADTAEIEHRLKADVALGLSLLRLANTPAVSSHPIDSLRQALIALGRNQLQRWLQLMLYKESQDDSRHWAPLLVLAAGRGRLMELLALHLRPGNRGIADTAFTVGIMSLMDTLFGMPMETILQQMPVSDEVADALLHRKGQHGELLRLAEYTEWAENVEAPLLEAVRRLRLSCSRLYALQLAAFEWSDQVLRGLH